MMAYKYIYVNLCEKVCIWAVVAYSLFLVEAEQIF